MPGTKQLESFLNAHEFTIVDRLELEGHAARYSPLPERLHAEVQKILSERFPNGLYTHQAEAISAVIGGMDVCLATATASGKSLVFQSAAANLLKRIPSAKVLALYPARALIQDQKEKWEALLEPLDLRVRFIDGGVPVDSRPAILREAHVLLMTPDVAHAWLMSHLRNPEVRAFLNGLHLLVLDEAHVYEGVFGTNMAYFLRRLQAVARPFRIICSTATVGQPDEFISQLTGRKVLLINSDKDGAAHPHKTLLLAQPPSKNHFDASVNLLRSLAASGKTRFLAFGDSRRMVELVVAAVHRPEKSPAISSDDASESVPEDGQWLRGGHQVLPYRAGYETEDRNAIQSALTSGELVGVVATSSLELGIDIGEIDLVVLLNVPPTMKAFWQRFGRAGRRNKGTCLLIDSRGVLCHLQEPLQHYVRKPLEPSWIYLENRYIQYANALCTAAECADAGPDYFDPEPFQTLPESFRQYLENELNPTESIPEDLYALKQRAQCGPQMEFPLRSAAEKSFSIREARNRNLGTISYPQALREAYPGAVYYYMARPHRIWQFSYRDGEIRARTERNYVTEPLVQARVFPDFLSGIHQLFRSRQGFVAETSMQVSERVLGFSEKRGSVREQHQYGAGSLYSQRPLSRLFQTTGVCWHFPDIPNFSDESTQQLLQTFCLEYGVQERDLGIGLFHARTSPLGEGTVQGVCIFDATNGSLRLTEALAHGFKRVVEQAVSDAELAGNAKTTSDLQDLLAALRNLQPAQVSPGGLSRSPISTPTDDDWVMLISSGEEAIYNSLEGQRQIVSVLGYRYSPKGWLYDLRPYPPMERWTVPVEQIQPVPGQTRLVRVNVMTGEEEPVEGFS